MDGWMTSQLTDTCCGLGHMGVPDLRLVCNLMHALEYCSEHTILHGLPKTFELLWSYGGIFKYNSEHNTDVISEWIYCIVLAKSIIKTCKLKYELNN